MSLFFRKVPVVIRPREQHPISRRDIDPAALRVLYRLSEAGHKAYLVGGGVRDLLLGRKPKDFDISTDAHPNEIRRLFRNCFLVGRRFRLAHVVFGPKTIETSTFRKQPPTEAADEDVPGGLYQNSDNTFGTPEEDAKRRDFTVNGLFYDIRTFSIIDYVGGLRDLEKRVLRCIGDPNIRFREDPVRMMRAVRFSARLGLRMDWATRRAIRRHHAEIAQASSARLLDEILKLFSHAAAAPTFRLLWETRLMAVLLPEVDAYVAASGGRASPMWAYLRALDALPESDLPASNGLRLATLYYPLFLQRVTAEQTRATLSNHLHLGQALLEQPARRMHLPKAIYFHMLHVIDAQQRFTHRPPPHRRVRFGMVEVFDDALRLSRMHHAVTGACADHLPAWQKVRSELTARPRHTGGERGADGPPSVTLPTADENTANTPSPSGNDDPGAPERKRRRRRGGRRHRRDNAGQMDPNSHETPRDRPVRESRADTVPAIWRD